MIHKTEGLARPCNANDLFLVAQGLQCGNCLALEDNGPYPPEEKPPYPSFFAQHGRHPISGLDFDPDGFSCQDDYEYFTGTGGYSDNVKPGA